MRYRTVITGAVALVLVACTKPPLDDLQQKALGDSLAQYVAGPFLATLEHPNIDSIMALYAPGNAIQVVDFGAIYGGRDAVLGENRKNWATARSAHFTLGAPFLSVLSRDAAVYTALVTGSMTDTAGVATPMQFAWTGVFVRVNGAWKLQAEHSSVPLPPPPAAPARRR
jgi:ketosteroid isomerase-like protein